MVEVFKTNVSKVSHARDLVAFLQQYFPGSRVNIDLEDCDKVLRVEGKNFAAGNIIRLVEGKGYNCTPLD